MLSTENPHGRKPLANSWWNTITQRLIVLGFGKADYSGNFLKINSDQNGRKKTLMAQNAGPGPVYQLKQRNPTNC